MTVQASTTIIEGNVGDGRGSLVSFYYFELIALISAWIPRCYSWLSLDWIPSQSISLFDAYPYSKLVRMNTVVGVSAIYKIIS